MQGGGGEEFSVRKANLSTYHRASLGPGHLPIAYGSLEKVFFFFFNLPIQISQNLSCHLPAHLRFSLGVPNFSCGPQSHFTCALDIESRLLCVCGDPTLDFLPALLLLQALHLTWVSSWLFGVVQLCDLWSLIHPAEAMPHEVWGCLCCSSSVLA